MARHMSGRTSAHSANPIMLSRLRYFARPAYWLVLVINLVQVATIISASAMPGTNRNGRPRWIEFLPCLTASRELPDSPEEMHDTCSSCHHLRPAAGRNLQAGDKSRGATVLTTARSRPQGAVQAGHVVTGDVTTAEGSAIPLSGFPALDSKQSKRNHPGPFWEGQPQ